jgi:hypothetical protein
MLGFNKAGQAARRVNRPRQGWRGSSPQGRVHGVFTIWQPVPTGHFVDKLNRALRARFEFDDIFLLTGIAHSRRHAGDGHHQRLFHPRVGLFLLARAMQQFRLKYVQRVGINVAQGDGLRDPRQIGH